MVQRAEAEHGLAGTLDVSEAQVWADFDALLPEDATMLDPGPEWVRMTDFVAHLVESRKIGGTTARRVVTRLQDEGRLEIKSGKALGGQPQKYVRVVK